jgi:hypothetical protein
MRRRYAQGTTVSLAKSREQIGKLLENWGALGVQWTDEWYPVPRFACRFIWNHEHPETGVVHSLAARFMLVCDNELLRERSIDGRTGEVSENKYEKVRKQWVNEAHRLLLLFLKAAFNAIEAGLIAAEQIFMPFIEHASGQTIGQLFAAKLDLLPTNDAVKLLSSGNHENLESS